MTKKETLTRTSNYTPSYQRLNALFLGSSMLAFRGLQPGDEVEITSDVSGGKLKATGKVQSNHVISSSEVGRLARDANLEPGDLVVLKTGKSGPITLEVDESPESSRREGSSEYLSVANEVSDALDDALDSLDALGREDGPPVFCVSVASGPAGAQGGVNTASALLVAAMNSAKHFEAISVFTDPNVNYRDQEFFIGDAELHRRISAKQDEGTPVWVLGHGRWTGNEALRLAKSHLVKRIHFVHTAPIQTAAARNQVGEGDRALKKVRKENDLLAGTEAGVFVGNAGTDFLPRVDPEARSFERFLFPVLPGAPEQGAPFRMPATKILVAGRLDDGDVKGLGLATRTIRALADVRTDTGGFVQLVVCGADRQTERKLQKWVKRQRKCSVVALSFVGQSDLKRQMQTSALTLLPSGADALGLVALEALAAGRPCLVSEYAGVAMSYRLHGFQDWVLPADDPDAWAQAVTSIVKEEEPYRRALDDSAKLQTRIYKDAVNSVSELGKFLLGH